MSLSPFFFFIDYAIVTRALGDCRFNVYCIRDEMERMGIVPGRMRRRVYVHVGNLVLISRREFETDKVDIVHKYSDSEGRQLQVYDEIPSSIRLNMTEAEMAMGGVFGEEKENGEGNILFDETIDISQI